MKITSTEIVVLGDPPAPDPLPAGLVDARVAALAVLRVRTDAGIIGVSEVFAVPPGVARAVLDGPDSLLGQRALGEDPCPPERLWTRLYDSLMHSSRRGWAIICLGALDVAAWDIYGQALGRPVYELLGGAERAPDQVAGAGWRREVVPYCTLYHDRDDHDSVVRQQEVQAETLVGLGFRAVKVEPTRSAPATIVETARRARTVLGPARQLAVDVGYFWNDVPTALRVAEQLAEFEIAFLETPFPVDALAAYAALAPRCPFPLAAGEHTVTRWEFLDLMDRGGVQVVQPYMTTVGGLTEARRVVDLARARGALVCPGNWSTHLLSAATVHLAAMSPITPLFEYVAPEVYWSPLRRALQQVGLPVVNGAIPLPTAPGLGIALPDDLVAHFRIG